MGITKSFRRRSRLGKTAKHEVQGYVQAQFTRFQKHQAKVDFRQFAATVVLSATIGALVAFAILRQAAL